jgi:hypothetical protein
VIAASSAGPDFGAGSEGVDFAAGLAGLDFGGGSAGLGFAATGLADVGDAGFDAALRLTAGGAGSFGAEDDGSLVAGVGGDDGRFFCDIDAVYMKETCRKHEV